MARRITQEDVEKMKERRKALSERIKKASETVRKRRDRRLVDLGLAFVYGLWPKWNEENRKKAIERMMDGVTSEYEAKRRQEAIDWLVAGMP